MSFDNSSLRDWGRNSLVDVYMGFPGTYAQEPVRHLWQPGAVLGIFGFRKCVLQNLNMLG